MLTIPFKLPDAHTFLAGVVATTADLDTGGYDLMIGGHGFRLATDTNYPYQRVTEPTTVKRFDSSLEPGEQSLADLPWIKAQSSFHAGAGQLNLEQGFTAFQYQQEQVEHIRFDTSLGIDCWTPGELKRLPDTTFTALGFTATYAVTAAIAGQDYAVVDDSAGGLQQLHWASGPDAAPTVTGIDLSAGTFGGASNCTVRSLCTDGRNYYAVLQLAAGAAHSLVVKGDIGSAVAPTVLYTDASATYASTGIAGWAKQRLMYANGTTGGVYELDTAAAAAAFPTAKYTHPAAGGVSYTAFSESPDGVLAAVVAGGTSSILQFTLDTSGAVPTLAGGTNVATLPPGEQITAMEFYLGSFLAVASTSGVRVTTFDTYTGALKQGPLSITSTQPTQCLTGRDRFIYAGYTNQQADGTTGLVRIDLSMVVDVAGRLAHAPDLRPATTATSRTGAVTAAGVLPSSNRVMFLTPSGIHIEGAGPGSDGDAWLRTSRIRYDTSEPKLFTFGRLQGSLDVAEISITGIMPFQSDVSLGTFGFVPNGDPGQWGLPAGTHEWLQLKFDLIGSACVMNAYQVKALPAPQRQNLIVFTVNCFRNETDRFGLEVTDPETPRKRYQNVQDLETTGGQVRVVEFTNTGPIAQLVVIDQLQFQSFSRPNVDDDFGGYITFKLRSTGA